MSNEKRPSDPNGAEDPATEQPDKTSDQAPEAVAPPEPVSPPDGDRVRPARRGKSIGKKIKGYVN
jgi:hypothetical protein